jgi:transcriptional regulator with XRE-family HTH domain
MKITRKKSQNYDALLEEERLILDATEAIQRLMDDQELTRVELARRIGSTKGNVSQLLDGNRNMTLRTLARLLGAVGHRGKIVTEPLSHRVSAPRPLQTHKIHAHYYFKRVPLSEDWSDQLETLRGSLLHHDVPSDPDEEFAELLQGAA